MVYSFNIKKFSGPLATLVVTGLSVASIKTFLKGIFQRAFSEGSTSDLIMAISILLFGVYLILVGKDAIDGGGFSKKKFNKHLQDWL